MSAARGSLEKGSRSQKGSNDTVIRPSTSKDTVTQPAKSKDSVSGTVQECDRLNEDCKENKDEERERFSSPIAFVLTTIGYVVGLGNIWRFPLLAYENGGGAFLIPYLIFYILFGLPTVYMEMAMGQYMQSSPGTIFFKFVPALQGIGWAMSVQALQINTYYYIIVSWAVLYLSDIVVGRSGVWTSCSNDWNTELCFSQFDENLCSRGSQFYFNRSCHPSEFKSELANRRIYPIAAADEYFENSILMKTTGIEEVGDVNWKILGVMFLLWSICSLVLWSGLKTMGWIYSVAVSMMFAIVVILLIHGLTLPGALSGLDYFILSSDYTKLYTLQTWSSALKQVLFTLSLGQGGLHTLGSLSKKDHNCYRSALLVVLADLLMSLFGGFAVFTVLGFVSVKTTTPMKDVAQGGFSLAFVVFPEAMTMTSVPWMWTFLFFTMLILLGFTGIVMHSLTAITCLIDTFPSLQSRKRLFAFPICFLQFIFGIIMYTKSGIYWVTLVDKVSGNVSLCVLLFLQAIIVAYKYGIENFLSDIESMLGASTSCFSSAFGRTGGFFRIMWLTVTPVSAVIALIIMGAREELSYGSGNRLYKFPLWSEVVGWILDLWTLCLVPIGLFVNIRRIKRETGDWQSAFSLHPTHPSYTRIKEIQEDIELNIH